VKRIEKYGIILRSVEIEDAEFILKLRTDEQLSRYISPTLPDINVQISWIENYKKREEAGKEYYYIAEDQKGNRFGTIRIYNFDEKSFEIGSWLFMPNSPLGMAVKAQFIGFEQGFETLKVEFCRLEVRKKNTAVLRYFRDFEKVFVTEDDLNYYFTLSKENFYKRRAEIPFFKLKPKKPEGKLFIHPTAEVLSENIGEGTYVWQFCVILKDAVIGKNCNLNCNVFVENDVIIGDNVTIKSGVQLWDGLRIENNVFISPNVAFTNDIAPRSKNYPKQFLRTTIKEGASLGANSTIVGGITIGKFAMIGAGSVVTKNVPDYNLWYGHPATFKAYICKCGKKLNDCLDCGSCGKSYKLFNGAIVEDFS
jgi:acetyltransferase-like isoleucine patch superfamily enzyme/RimJ/RimL family protein N-acetyltransferase